MIGIDTNLIVRLLTNDDHKQAQYAQHLIENNTIFIAKSVLLETEWVLRYTYDLSPEIILMSFKKLLGLNQIFMEDTQNVAQALKWYEIGFDFADALHLASSHKTKNFATLDKNFVKNAKKLKINLLTM